MAQKGTEPTRQDIHISCETSSGLAVLGPGAQGLCGAGGCLEAGAALLCPGAEPGARAGSRVWYWSLGLHALRAHTFNKKNTRGGAKMLAR